MDSHGHHEHQQHSSSELLSSAKMVAEAAQSALNNRSANNIDKAKVADAAADLLDGARQYGKLEDKGLGQYVDKAESYLHQYGAAGGHSEKSAVASKTEAHGDKHSSEKPESHGGGGGYGNYMKMAEGFFKKW